MTNYQNSQANLMIMSLFCNQPKIFVNSNKNSIRNFKTDQMKFLKII